MIEQLRQMNQPDWLSCINPQSTMGNIRLEDVLYGSLYYPASGLDGDPIAYLAGNYVSFVYVDYCVSRDALWNELNSRGFRGYEVVAHRSVDLEKLVPVTPDFPLPQRGSPAAKYRENMERPFCEWVILQRQDGFREGHGPQRFSLLYLCAEGVAAFRALYVANGLGPAAVAIIQPGTGFGLNWTDFEDQKGPFGTAVLENPGGKPDVLLFGGALGPGGRHYYEQPCWPEYSKSLGFLGNTSISVWHSLRSG